MGPRALAAALKKEMSENECEYPVAILKTPNAQKDKGMEAYRKCKYLEAHALWSGTVTVIDGLWRRPSWMKIVDIGGEPFLDKISELQFKLCINTAQCTIKQGEPADGNVLKPQYNPRDQRTYAECGLDFAQRCLMPHYWKLGYIWECSDGLLVKLLYRQTLCIRLWGDRAEGGDAWDLLSEALELAPKDRTILQEKQNLVDWLAEE